MITRMMEYLKKVFSSYHPDDMKDVRIDYHVDENVEGARCDKCWREGRTMIYIVRINDKRKTVKAKYLCSRCISHKDVWNLL